MELIAVVTTVATIDEARRIAREVVEAGLAACAQLSTIESVYVWEGATQQEPEIRIVFKTAAARWPAIAEAIRRRHSYALPAIVAVPLPLAEPAFAAWVCEGSSGLPG